MFPTDLQLIIAFLRICPGQQLPFTFYPLDRTHYESACVKEGSFVDNITA